MAGRLFLATTVATLACYAHATTTKHPGYALDLLGPDFVMPDEWGLIADTCDSKKFATQSPIDITTKPSASSGGGHRRNAQPAPSGAWSAASGGKTVVAPAHYHPIKLAHQNNLVDLKFHNNGHAMQVDMKATGYGTAAPTFHGGALPNEFNVAQLHFHWGKNDATGSEHTLNGGTHMPLEMHIVTTNSEYTQGHKYATNGLAVVGVWFEIGAANPEIQKLIDQIGSGKVLESKSAAKVSLSIDGLLPKGGKGDGAYFSYDGGLTTPPCTATVIWHLFEQKSTVSSAQMAAIRTLKMSATSVIGQNYRPTQARSGRTVKLYSGHVAGHAVVCEEHYQIPFIAALVFAFIVVCISAFIWRGDDTTMEKANVTTDAATDAVGPSGQVPGVPVDGHGGRTAATWQDLEIESVQKTTT